MPSRFRPLRTDDEVLEFAAAHAPTKACATACRTLGDGMVARVDNGWMVFIESWVGTRWVGHITVDETARRYKIKWDGK